MQAVETEVLLLRWFYKCTRAEQACGGETWKCVVGVDTETPKNNQNDASIIQWLSDSHPTILRQCKLHPLPSLLQELRADAGKIATEPPHTPSRHHLIRHNTTAKKRLQQQQQQQTWKKKIGYNDNSNYSNSDNKYEWKGEKRGKLDKSRKKFKMN